LAEVFYLRQLELALEITRGFHLVSKHQGCEPIADRIALAFERRMHRIKDLPADIAEGIRSSKVNPAHDHLNALLDETK